MKMLQREHRPKCCRNSLGLPKGVAKERKLAASENPPIQGVRARMIRAAPRQVRGEEMNYQWWRQSEVVTDIHRVVEHASDARERSRDTAPISGWPWG